jgi:hypothetical protein
MARNAYALHPAAAAVVLACSGAWLPVRSALAAAAEAAPTEAPEPDPAGSAAGTADDGGVEVWFLGPAREISHSSSASRDTAALAMQFLPRPILSGGGDFGVFCLRWGGMTWRTGFLGMLELESETGTQGFAGTPAGDIRFWRGLWGYSLAYSPDRLAERWLGEGSALEAALSFRHESEHYTGSNEGDAGTDYGDRPHIGNFVMLDLAVRWRAGPVALVGRLQHKFFLPEASGYSHGPGADLVVRWHLWDYIHPFVSVFGEYLFGAHVAPYGRFPDAYLVRGLLGLIVPSAHGDLYVFMSADVGHRKGLAVYTEEATLGGGIRAAFF